MEKQLLSHGIKPTKNRMVVVEYLNGVNHPVTAPDMLEYLQQQSSINKVTLYRILDLFEAQGVVIKHRADDRSFRYCLKESEQSAHCHFLCTECGKMTCMDMDHIALNPEYIQQTGYQVSNIEIRIDGKCQDCQ